MVFLPSILLLPSLCLISSNSYRLVTKSTFAPTKTVKFTTNLTKEAAEFDGIYEFVNDSVEGPHGHEMCTYFFFYRNLTAYWVVNLSRFPTRKIMCGGFQMTNVTTNFTVYFNWEIIDKPLPGNKYSQRARNLTWKTYPPNTKIYSPKWKLDSNTFRQIVKFKGKRNGEWYYTFGNTVIRGGTEGHTVIDEDLTKVIYSSTVWDVHNIDKRSITTDYKETLDRKEYDDKSINQVNNKNKYTKKDEKNFVKKYIKVYKEKYHNKLWNAAKCMVHVFDDWFKHPLKSATKKVVKKIMHLTALEVFIHLKGQIFPYITGFIHHLLERRLGIYPANGSQHFYTGVESPFKGPYPSFQGSDSSSRDSDSSSRGSDSSSRGSDSSSTGSDSSSRDSDSSEDSDLSSKSKYARGALKG